MNIKSYLFIVLMLSCLSLNAQDPLIVNTYNRKSTLLNGDWKYIIDPYENGYDQSLLQRSPHDRNA